MSWSIIIHDETASGSITNQLRLKIDRNHITAKELIKMRVFHEVNAFNARKNELYRGLIQPNNAKPMLNGYKLNPRYKIDPQKQYYVAMDAFKRQGFHLIIDDQKIDDPDFTIDMESNKRVSFMKLTPLVGG